MEKYNYNERLIEKLNITSFIEKYNFDNELYNNSNFFVHLVQLTVID